MKFEPIDSAEYVADGTIADLKMANGRIYRAVWAENGFVTAWWPLAGHGNRNRKAPIALYEPTEWARTTPSRHMTDGS